MRYSSPFRPAVALVLCVTITALSIAPSVAAAAAQAPGDRRSGADALAANVFDGIEPDRRGAFERRVQGSQATELAFFYAPEGGSFSRRMVLDVEAGAGRLQLALVGAGRGRRGARVRLTDPIGRVIRPGRKTTDIVALGLTTLPESIREVQARQLAGDVTPGADGESGTTPARIGSFLRGDGGGVHYRVPGRDDALINVVDPMPGRWTATVVADGADALFVSYGVVDAAGLRATLEGCDCGPKAAGNKLCVLGLKFVFSTLAIAMAGAVSAKFFGASVGSIVTLATVEMTVLTVDVLTDILVEAGVIKPASATALELAALARLLVGSLALAKVTIVQAVAATYRWYSRGKSVTQAADWVCKRLEPKSAAFGPHLPAPGQVGQPYNDHLLIIEGDFPYVVELKSGNFPSGLKLNAGSGQITGKPTHAGTFRFRAKLSDKKGKSERVYEIQVYEKPDDNRTDLIIKHFSSTKVEALPDDRVEVAVTVANDGGVPAVPGRIDVVWSRSPSRQGAVQLGSAIYPTLGTDADFSPQRIRFKMPRLTRDETLFLGVIADATDSSKREKTATGKDGEKNNEEWISVRVRAKVPYDVEAPSKGQILTADESFDIQWQSPQKVLQDVIVELWQNGAKLQRLFAGRAKLNGNRARTTWKVPATLSGSGFRIVVNGKGNDPSIFAESGLFSIESAVVDLTGTWRTDITVSLTAQGSTLTEGDSVDLKFVHNAKNGKLEVLAGNDLLGKFDTADGAGFATVLIGEITHSASASPFSGNLLNAPTLLQVMENSGSFTLDRATFRVKLRFDLANTAGDLIIDVTYDARRK